jgi:hypothetical protein
MSARAVDVSKKITRDDIEAKLRELRGEVEHRTEAAKTTGIAVGVGVVMVVVIVAYMAGRRRARKRQPVLEIRRI